MFFYVLTSFLQRLAWAPTRVFLSSFLGFNVHGHDHLGRAARHVGGVIFAANHLWEIDPILLTAGIPFWGRLLPMHYVAMAKEHYQHLPGWRAVAGGRIFKAWGAYPALLGVKNFDLSLREHLHLLKQGKSLCIFPEGGMCRAGATYEPKPGVAYLAWKTGACIVPVRLVNSGPFTSRDFFARRLRAGVVYGEPFSFADVAEKQEEYSVAELKLIAARIMARVSALPSPYAL